MDPISTILINAVVAGAVKGLGPTAEKAVSDAYAGFRRLISDGYKKLVPAVEQVEQKHDSQPKQDSLAEDLKDSDALRDEKLLAAARAVVAAAERTNDPRLTAVIRRTKEAEFEIEQASANVEIHEADKVKFKVKGGPSGN